MNNGLYYRGFTSIPKYSADDNMFYGTLDNIEDIVIYDAERAEDLKDAFVEAVDDYLDALRETHRSPVGTYCAIR